MDNKSVRADSKSRIYIGLDNANKYVKLQTKEFFVQIDRITKAGEEEFALLKKVDAKGRVPLDKSYANKYIRLTKKENRILAEPMILITEKEYNTLKERL